MTDKKRFTKQDYALLNLGRVYGYTKFLVKVHMMAADQVMLLCRRYYSAHPEIGMTFEDALDEAIRRREEAFARVKSQLKEDE